MEEPAMAKTVIIVGAGIVGLFTAYTLAESGYDVIVLEAGEAPGSGITSRNANVIHVIQLPFKSLRSRLCIQGNKLYHDHADTLGLRVRWTNLILASTRPWARTLSTIARRYLSGHLPAGYKVESMSGDRLRDVEPGLSDAVKHGLVVGGYGVLDTVHAVERLTRAVEQAGGIIEARRRVTRIRVEPGRVRAYAGEAYTGDLLVNSAGLEAARIAEMTGDSFKIEPVEGVMTVHDRPRLDNIVSWLRLELSHKTKGGGVIPQVDGSTLLGPTYGGLGDPEGYLRSKFQPLLAEPLGDPRRVVRGERPVRPRERDFYIGYSRRTRRIIHLVGIESPGLTAAPAIAERVLSLVRASTG